MELALSFLFGIIGTAYFVYGKRQHEFTFMLTGGLLCFYPYFVSGVAAITAVGILIMCAPFVARHFGW